MKYFKDYKVIVCAKLYFCIVFTALLFLPVKDTFAALDEPILPVPIAFDVDLKKVALGRMLFNETLLSGDNTLSCASCHAIDNFGVDGLKKSVGVNGSEASFNAPTVLNSRFNFAQFWDGRAHELHDQVSGPLISSIEMGSTWVEVEQKLSQSTFYAKKFDEIYEDGISAKNISDAITHYEMTLVTINSPFDQYLRGDIDAITDQQKRGYKLFKDYGCIACHQGVNVGGNLYQRMGALIPYFTDKDKENKNNRGLFNVTEDETDLFVFKVPSLRLVTHTAPYFHDGSVGTLSEAIEIMARYQLGISISKEENLDIEAFLRSLSGELPGEFK